MYVDVLKRDAGFEVFYRFSIILVSRNCISVYIFAIIGRTNRYCRSIIHFCSAVFPFLQLLCYIN